SATREPLIPAGASGGSQPPAVPAESLTEEPGLLGEASELTTPGLEITGSEDRSSPTPSGVNPTGSSPPSGPSAPNRWPGTTSSIPALVSGSASTASAIAQLSAASPEVSAARLALAVV